MKTLNIGSVDFDAMSSTAVPHLPKSWTISRIQSAIYCLTYNGHKSGVIMLLEKIKDKRCVLRWKNIGREMDKIERANKDHQVAAELGAEGVAAILVKNYTEYTIIERSQKGTGIDYFLGKGDENYLPFSHAARLEVSGLLTANKKNDFKTRVNKKKKQSKKSDNSELPAYISVVDFGVPKAILVKR